MADLLSLLDARTLDDCQPRGDELAHHVAHLSGCDREKYGGYKGWLVPFDADTARKFEMGIDIENRIIAKLIRDYPDIQLGLRVALWLGLESEIEGKIVTDDYKPRPYEIIGHPDGVTDDAVIEVKSTEFLIAPKTWERIVPTQPEQLPWGYKMQAAAYAIALCRTRAIIIQQCRVSGKESVIEFDPRSMLADLKARIRATIKITPSGALPEPTLHESTINAKGLSWLCKYCRFTKTPAHEGCKFNRAVKTEVAGRMLVEL
jgi:hypothetical protein